MTADSTSLGIGESVQLTVQKKVFWFRAEELTDPSKTTYWTTSESAFVAAGTPLFTFEVIDSLSSRVDDAT